MELDFEALKELLPQRFPYIMIDKVSNVEPDKEAVALKNVSGNDIFFLGHFPERAVLPGTAIVEAMAQTAIVIFTAGKTVEDNSKRPIYYLGSIKSRFFKPVVPGDQLKIKAKAVKLLPTGGFVSAEAFVENDKVSEADLVFSVKNEK